MCFHFSSHHRRKASAYDDDAFFLCRRRNKREGKCVVGPEAKITFMRNMASLDSWDQPSREEKRRTVRKKPNDVIGGKWAIYEWRWCEWRRRKSGKNMGAGGALRASTSESEWHEKVNFDNLRNWIRAIIFRQQHSSGAPTHRRKQGETITKQTASIDLQLLRSQVGAERARRVDGVLPGQRSVRLLHAALPEPRQRDLASALGRLHRQQIHNFLWRAIEVSPSHSAVLTRMS